MTEIYANISEQVRELAKLAWKIAMMHTNPINSAKFLNTVTEYYRNILTDEEIEFLQFYFQTQMEMMKK